MRLFIIGVLDFSEIFMGAATARPLSTEVVNVARCGSTPPGAARSPIDERLGVVAHERVGLLLASTSRRRQLFILQASTMRGMSLRS
jgi:hypothetical protein